MKYRIKPEYADLWGEDVTEDTVITEADLEMIARGWEKDPEELKAQLIEEEDEEMEKKLWYAVQRDRDDDWGTGCYDLEEAKHMAREQADDYPDTLIAVIDGSECVEEITDFGKTVFSGYDPDGNRCWAVLEGGRLFIDYGEGMDEAFNDEWYDDDFDFNFMLIHEGFRRC